MNKVRTLREKNNMTQTELAEKSGVSLRTIQRIEKGGALKGFTLNSIANTLLVSADELIEHAEIIQNFERAKLINLSVLAGFVIPYGGIIFPLILTAKTKDLENKNIGKRIVEVQIILTMAFSIIFIAIPFLQKFLAIKQPLFIIAIILFLVLKLFIVIKNGIALNQRNSLSIYLKNRFL